MLGMVLVVMAACNGVGDREAVGRQLMEADRAFAAETAANGLNGWLNWFDKQAAVFPRDRNVVNGLAAIRAFYEETGFDPTGLKWEPERAVVSDDGTLGMTYGTWTMVDPSVNGESEIARGKYMTVWRLNPEGKWRVVADMGNTDMEAVPEAGEALED